MPKRLTAEDYLARSRALVAMAEFLESRQTASPADVEQSAWLAERSRHEALRCEQLAARREGIIHESRHILLAHAPFRRHILS